MDGSVAPVPSPAASSSSESQRWTLTGAAHACTGPGGGRPAEGVNALYLARDKRAVRSSSWYSTNTLLSLARTR